MLITVFLDVSSILQFFTLLLVIVMMEITGAVLSIVYKDEVSSAMQIDVSPYQFYTIDTSLYLKHLLSKLYVLCQCSQVTPHIITP